MESNLDEQLKFFERAKKSALSELAGEENLKKLAIKLYFSTIEEEIKNPGYGKSLKEFVNAQRDSKYSRTSESIEPQGK